MLQYLREFFMSKLTVRLIHKMQNGHFKIFCACFTERLDIRYGLERPLGHEEQSQLRMCGPYLLYKLLITEELICLLCASGAITDQHRDHVNGQRTMSKKITEFVNIMKRRSVAAFKAFISALHETNQSHIADVLSKPGGRFHYYQLLVNHIFNTRISTEH